MQGGNYIREGTDSVKSNCLIFSPKEEDEIGSLGKYLDLFAVSKIWNVIDFKSMQQEDINAKYYDSRNIK